MQKSIASSSKNDYIETVQINYGNFDIKCTN